MKPAELFMTPVASPRNEEMNLTTKPTQNAKKHLTSCS